MMNKIKKIMGGAAVALSLAVIFTEQSYAVGVAYFSLPVDFADNVTATIVAIAGTLLGLLGLMFAWRKTVKSTNRS